MQHHSKDIIPQYQVAIIGAGFGGIVAARAFKPLVGDGMILFEKADKPGGVWRDNTYPGCTCDVPSDLYSIKSLPNPVWSTRFAAQPEILAYIERSVEESDIDQYIQYKTAITNMHFVEAGGYWIMNDDQGNEYSARMVIMATGSLNKPKLLFKDKYPLFKGKILHSAMWDGSYDYRGKKIAIVGTGASAVQIIPKIAADAGELYVFQRSPAWIMPRMQNNRSKFLHAIYKFLPPLQSISREMNYWLYEMIGLALTGNQFIHKALSKHASAFLTREIKDPALRKKLTPDYQLGCKRILISDTFYRTFNRPNVHLVTGTVSGIVPNGVISENGDVTEVDVIIFATGFDLAGAINAVDATGLDGHTLRGDYEKSIEAYLGITVTNYPNFTFIMGPNSGIGHISVIHMIESQVDYIVKYWKALTYGSKNKYLNVKPNVQQQYNKELKAKFVQTVWASGCKSWYVSDEGKNFTLHPELAWRYRKKTRKFDLGDYEKEDIKQ